MTSSQPVNRSRPEELPSWFWLWLVPVFVAVEIVVRAISPELSSTYLNGEQGIVENFTVLLLIPSIFLAAYLVSQSRHLPVKWLSVWYGLLGLACLYFAGEEASWGQHWFGWQTPEGMRELNDQQETNFHNMSSWLDQKPRLIVELSAIIGGVLLPIVRRMRGVIYPQGSWQDLFWPTWVCLPVSMFIGFIKIPDRIFGAENIPHPFNLRVSETQELYVGLGFLIYMTSVAVRVYRAKNQSNI